MAKTFDLSTLGLADGTYSITVKAKGTNLIESNASEGVSYTVAPSGAVISAGTWVFNDNIDFLSYGSYELNFNCNNISYTSIFLDSTGGEMRYKGTTDTLAMYFSEWESNIYKTITISTDQTVSEEFATWFNANCTKQTGKIQLTGAEGDLLIIPDSWIGKTWYSLVGENIGNWELEARGSGVGLIAGIWSGRIYLGNYSVEAKDIVTLTTYTCEIEN